MSSPPSWTAHLNCGHAVGTQSRPAEGNWISCLAAGCWRQERVVSVSPALTAAPREFQGALWELAELKEAA